MNKTAIINSDEFFSVKNFTWLTQGPFLALASLYYRCEASSRPRAGVLTDL